MLAFARFGHRHRYPQPLIEAFPVSVNLEIDPFQVFHQVYHHLRSQAFAR